LLFTRHVSDAEAVHGNGGCCVVDVEQLALSWAAVID
jgi:hypothetical protein